MLRTLSQLKNLKGKRVLVRVDFNVPMSGKRITETTRIKQTLPTIKYLLKQKARVILVSHLGRPEGKVVSELSLKPIGAALAKLLNKKVAVLTDCIGPKVEASIAKMKDGEVVMLENVRFYKEEEKNEVKFAKSLAKLAQIYVNDAFAACHRAHASTYRIAKLLPSYAGFLVEHEMKHLMPIIKKAPKKLTLVVGGAKVDTKIGMLKHFFGKADYILIGGALANTFLAAEGYDVGESKYEKDKVEVARELLMLAEKKKQKLVIPCDVIVADTISNKSKTLNLPIQDIVGDMKILDIGIMTQAAYSEAIHKSKVVLWNGPMGLTEFTPFIGGTGAIAKTLASLKGKVASYIGGGDTQDAITRLKIPTSKFTFISTGGGAMLEFLEGKKLPGIEVLMK